MLVMELKTGDLDGWRQYFGKWGANAIFGRYLTVANFHTCITFSREVEFCVVHNISGELISISNWLKINPHRLGFA